MKMKNMLIGGMSLALVACISIGGTLAYLSDNTGTVQNKFQMVTNGIVLNLQETATPGTGYDVYVKDADGNAQGEKLTKATTLNADTAGENVGFVYKEIQPGATLAKDVKLSIGKQNEDTVSSWVFACVENANGAALNVTVDGVWKKVANQDNKALYLYQGTEASAGVENEKYIPKFNGVKPLTSLFTTVGVPATTEQSAEFTDITVKGYAEQVDNNTYAGALANAKNNFGFKE
ncbi:SipW-dependent-type signal peptide-containing protein [uncultured Allofournierella sp.]|uniref:SipW-dependent-type signal peptide-containing protein n=1 Tax=uncultured Allofournierella sp. TaxID=1940258 RepID=UPI0025ECB440|nr:SipW-dependent-type signal peptide-containing protein [uncultured Fournierella sp.]